MINNVAPEYTHKSFNGAKLFPYSTCLNLKILFTRPNHEKSVAACQRLRSIVITQDNVITSNAKPKGQGGGLSHERRLWSIKSERAHWPKNRPTIASSPGYATKYFTFGGTTYSSCVAKFGSSGKIKINNAIDADLEINAIKNNR